jgi:hypothetical protein
MGSELNLTVMSWEGVALALLMDGRESVAVPSWQKNGGPIKKFRALPAGPIILINTSTVDTTSVQVDESSSSENIARRAEGLSAAGCESRTIEIAPGKAVTLVPRKPYLYVGNGKAEILLQPAGLLTRGPSAMPYQAPISIVWYPN